MSLVPIKLIKNISTRNRLLKIKDETPEIDKNDYIESRITTNARARNLMAIEDASEMAKEYLHEGWFLCKVWRRH
jgi:5,10-methylenetetrahydrofolate reductase